MRRNGGHGPPYCCNKRGRHYTYDIDRDKLGRIETIYEAQEKFILVNYNYLMSLVESRTYLPVNIEYEEMIYEIDYDDLGRAVRHYTWKRNRPDPPTTITDFNYAFDDNGNITAKEFAHLDASPDNDYTYDTLDRVTDVGYYDDSEEWFDYDKLGNRVEAQHRDIQGTLTYARNADTNRYDETGDYDIKAMYDAAGNITTDPDIFEYEYDYENRLIRIYLSDTDFATFTYDALGRRIQKYHEVDEITTTFYYNNNWQVLTEIEDNRGDVVERDFVYGNYIDEVLMMVIDDPNTYYYAHDHLYSPVALIDDEGVVQERYEYDAYGKPNIMDADFDLLPVQKSDYGNPYYFTGRRVDFIDEFICLQYARNRYYDYHTGRWLTPDRTGYADSMNLYQYAGSNPIRNRDPMGLDYVKVEDQIVWWVIEEDDFWDNDTGLMVRVGMYEDGVVKVRDFGDESTQGCILQLEDIRDAAGIFWNEYPDISDDPYSRQRAAVQGVVGRLCTADGPLKCPFDPPVARNPGSPWCREGKSKWHNGLMCFREIPPVGREDGQQCCYDYWSVLRDISPDACSPAIGKDEAGNCIWGIWSGEVLMHGIVDFVPWIVTHPWMLLAPAPD